ncbi:HNH endonuclease [Rhodococcus spongiicola]|uniref:HNH endonuclease n=1 Tax=Rhodococcus spongiicola TaxID=2487352 RepID=A0A3S3CSY3_9NOCA|nr:hypothetical protein [Rhodococcus spongiicola]RVW04882.1 hypothetical protein EF834_07820 [Rhodococcus spongiicola]
MSLTGHRTYRRNRDRILRTSDVCALCGQWIDPDLSYPDPMSASADHVTPVSKGGSNTGPLQATHLRCNLRRGNRDRLPDAGYRADGDGEARQGWGETPFTEGR